MLFDALSSLELTNLIATQNYTKLTNNSPPESHFHIYKALVYHINQTLQASPKFNLRGVLVTCGPEAQ